jgi:uncharacterized low-complexity protein
MENVTMLNLKSIAATLAVMGTGAVMMACGGSQSTKANEVPAAEGHEKSASCGAAKEGSCGAEKKEASCGAEKKEASCGASGGGESSCGAKHEG